MSNPADYTVGWICALPTESVAAQELLDEEHDIPAYVAPSDNNVYSLGRIGLHKVVIAVLPRGQYGLSSATAVARDMMATFRNIRIGLMIGIGGGAPTVKHDIRLGDIVVSAPGEAQGGVIQYNFGKAMQEQNFRMTGHLNQPPNLLLAAASAIQTLHERKGHRLNQTINDIMRKNPRLRHKYARPDLGTDRLYLSEVVHPDPNLSCTTTCGDHPSKVVRRHERGEHEDNPAIHYGLIASADVLMKDALVRDRLATENGVLCFEMEAAGLMNHFPCLVIRGICDYADSQKNKDWQGYAAMTAAAYAKELLNRIAPNQVEAERKAVDVLSGMMDRLS